MTLDERGDPRASPHADPPRSRGRRFADGAIGALSGGAAGAAAAALADPPGFPIAAAAALLALLGAGLGHRWGRGIVRVAAEALGGAPGR